MAQAIAGLHTPEDPYRSEGRNDQVAQLHDFSRTFLVVGGICPRFPIENNLSEIIFRHILLVRSDLGI
jgi:hypothetical protein